MYLLLIFAEILLTAALFVLLAVFAPTLLVLILCAVWIVFLYLYRPARRLCFRFRGRNRAVRRVFRSAAVPHDVYSRPDEKLSPAEIFRLMEIVGEIPADRRSVADFTSTLLDLNRRGILFLETGFHGDLFSGDDIRITFRQKTDTHALRRHEQIFLKLLHAACPSKAPSLQLPSFLEYAERNSGSAQRMTNGFRHAVDVSLLHHGILCYEPANPNASNAIRRFFSGRTLILTEKGEFAAALWRVYFKNSSSDPRIKSYVPVNPNMKPAFARDAFQLLTDAAAVGTCARTAQALSRGYIFDPRDLWNDKLYFSTLSETRTAFSENRNGESYFFLPLRDFESAIRTAVTYGAPQGKESE